MFAVHTISGGSGNHLQVCKFIGQYGADPSDLHKGKQNCFVLYRATQESDRAVANMQTPLEH